MFSVDMKIAGFDDELSEALKKGDAYYAGKKFLGI